MESLRYDRNRADVGLSQTKYYPHGQVSEIESEEFPPGLPLDYSDKGRQTSESKFHQIGEIPRMACQCGGGSKEE